MGSESPRRPERTPGQPTEAQRSAAGMAIFLHVDAAANNVAKVYAKETGGNFLKKRKARRLAKQALVDLYFAGDTTHAETSQLPTKYQERMQAQRSDIDRDRERIMHNAADLKKLKRIGITVKASTKLNKLPMHQKAQMLELAGFKPSEAYKAAESIGYSGILSLISGNLANLSIGGYAAYEGFTSVGEPKIDTASFVASYLAHYGSIGLKSWSNIRLLESKAVGTCANVASTSFFYAGRHASPENNFLPRTGVIGGGYFWAAIQEPGMKTILETVPGGEAIVFARNVGGTIYNIAETGVNTVWLKMAERRKKKKDSR